MSGYISSFTITVVCVILLSFILRAMMPRSSLEKYVNFVIGIIVTITLVGSFMGAPQLDFDEIVSADTSQAMTKENAAILYNERIAQQFRDNMENSISSYVQSVYGIECETEVMVNLSTDCTESGVDGVYINLSGSADEAALRREVAGRFGLSADIIHMV